MKRTCSWLSEARTTLFQPSGGSSAPEATTDLARAVCSSVEVSSAAAKSTSFRLIVSVFSAGDWIDAPLALASSVPESVDEPSLALMTSSSAGAAYTTVGLAAERTAAAGTLIVTVSGAEMSNSAACGTAMISVVLSTRWMFVKSRRSNGCTTSFHPRLAAAPSPPAADAAPSSALSEEMAATSAALAFEASPTSSRHVSPVSTSCSSRGCCARRSASVLSRCSSRPVGSRALRSVSVAAAPGEATTMSCSGASTRAFESSALGGTEKKSVSGCVRSYAARAGTPMLSRVSLTRATVSDDCISAFHPVGSVADERKERRMSAATSLVKSAALTKASWRSSTSREPASTASSSRSSSEPSSAISPTVGTITRKGCAWSGAASVRVTPGGRAIEIVSASAMSYVACCGSVIASVMPST